MVSLNGFRFKTDELCPESGWYRFDGYLNDQGDASVGINDLAVEVMEGKTFPPAGTAKRPCFWKSTVDCDEPVDDVFPVTPILE